MATKMKQQKNRVKSFFREWIEPIVLGTVLALFVRTFVLEIMKIPTGSMEPTLHGNPRSGDKVLVLKFSYWFQEPQRWDVMVFLFDKDTVSNPNFLGKVFGQKTEDGEVKERKNFIKRIAGLPGEKIEIRDGKIWINGEMVEKPSSMQGKYYYNMGEYGEEGKVTEIPPNCYVVLGDNSRNSRDSRYWGFVERKKIKGKAVVVLWPPNRWKVIR